MIEVGQKFPSVVIKQATPDGGSDVDTAELFAGKKVVVFALPGAFTPTCSTKHLPGFVRELPQLQASGVDLVACLSVNDHWVMKYWAEAHDAMGKIVMLADGNATLTRALGIDYEATKGNMGVRARRGMIIVDDGLVTAVEIEERGTFEVSSAEACLRRVGA